jgi:CheY-like chemotaxis protein
MSAQPMPRPIYIVEDDAMSRRLLNDVLTFHGYAVVAFETGEAALAALHVAAAAGELPTLLLLDIQLPGIDGFEVLRQVRADAALAPILCVAVTASVMHHDRQRMRDAGFDADIPKPVNLDDLLAVVARFNGAPP